MATKKLLAVFAVLQFLSLHLHVHGVSASAVSSAHKPTKPSGGGKCHISGFLHGVAGKCNREHGSDCCVAGHRYPQFKCSPPVSAETPAILTLNSFTAGGDGGGKSFCDNRFHKDITGIGVLTAHKPTKPSGGGKCHISGFLHGVAGKCNREHGSDCCVAGHRYPQFKCSPPVSAETPAILTLNSFTAGGDGGGKSFCDNRFHKDSELVVALSTGWLRLDGTRRCNKMIRINGNGRFALAKVVDECDSVNGCDAEHNFKPPCPNNVVDGSPAVWKALGLNEDIGEFKVTWSDM